MQVSHSRIDTYKNCPYQYKLRYIDKLKTLPTDDYASPLILGHALHTGIEKDVESAIKEYYGSYPVISDNHITEAMKLEYLIPKVKELLPAGIHEVKIEDDDFIGFIDLLVPVKKEPIYWSTGGTSGVDNLDEPNPPIVERYIEYYDLYDFKYSNNVTGYMESGQLHEYKYYFEKLNPDKKIRNLYFVFIPKSFLKMKYKNKTNSRDETIYEFRQRVLDDLKSKEIQIVKIQYDGDKVIEFLINSKHAIEDTKYLKNETKLCDYCEFKKYCQEGTDYEIIYPRKEN